MPFIFKVPPMVSPTITDDFESYNNAQTIPVIQNPDYVAENFNGGATWLGFSSILGGNKVLYVTTSGNTRAIMRYNPWVFTNGRVRSVILHRSDGIVPNFTRPGFVCRKTATNNYISAYMENDNNRLIIDDYNVTTSKTTVPFSPVSDVIYYFEMVFNGPSVTATIYSNPGYTTVLATVTNPSVTITNPGHAGLYVGNDTSIVEFDDMEITNDG